MPFIKIGTGAVVGLGLLCVSLLGSSTFTGPDAYPDPEAGAEVSADTSSVFQLPSPSRTLGRYAPRQLARVLDNERLDNERPKGHGSDSGRARRGGVPGEGVDGTAPHTTEAAEVHRGVVQSLLEVVDTIIWRAVNAHSALKPGA